MAPVGVFRSYDEQILEAVATTYNTVAVVCTGDRINMDVEGATFATWHPRLRMTGYSWDALAAACLLRAGGPPRSVLMLGLAGGTVARQLRALAPEAAITGVDIDAEVVNLARRHMALDELRIEVVISDADRFLSETERRFDVILDDLFLSGPTDVTRAREPIGSRLDLVKDRLTPGGIVATNLITDGVGPHQVLRKHVRRAFSEAFPRVRVVEPLHGLNEILVGGEQSLPGRALRRFAPRLEQPYDQTLFNGIRVRLLRRTARTSGGRHAAKEG
jgi:predicted membrane-bound spermidine synthase